MEMMSIKRFRLIILIVGFCMASMPVCAKKKIVELKPFTGTYWIEHFTSQRDAERQAEQLAIEDALAENFGIYTDTKNVTEVADVGGVASTNFINSGVSVSKGKLVKLLDSSFECSFVDNKLKVVATVHITAKEREAKVQLDTRILRHKEDSQETLNFFNNDDLYFYFQSPTDGYLAIYLEDENHKVFNLLPYMNDANGSVPVTHGKKYLFFCDDKSFFDRNKQYVRPESLSDIQSLYLQANKISIKNRIYVLFSPNKFARSNADYTNQLPELSEGAFQQWLGTLRMDDEFVDEFKDIIISPNKKY